MTKDELEEFGGLDEYAFLTDLWIETSLMHVMPDERPNIRLRKVQLMIGMLATILTADEYQSVPTWLEEYARKAHELHAPCKLAGSCIHTEQRLAVATGRGLVEFDKKDVH